MRILGRRIDVPSGPRGSDFPAAAIGATAPSCHRLQWLVLWLCVPLLEIRRNLYSYS